MKCTLLRSICLTADLMCACVRVGGGEGGTYEVVGKIKIKIRFNQIKNVYKKCRNSKKPLTGNIGDVYAKKSNRLGRRKKPVRFRLWPAK